MVHYQLGDDMKASPVSLSQKVFEITERAVSRMDAPVVGNVISVIFQRGGAKGKYPDGIHTEILKVVQLAGKTLEVPGTVAVTVAKSFDVELVNDGILVPHGLRLVMRILFPLTSHLS
jgi:hypothetical protein